MASPRTYECFVCKRNGVEGVQVYLDGKDPEGTGAAAATQQLMTSKPVSKEEIVPLLRIINAKLDRLLSETEICSNEEKETDGLLIE